jgi:hypothetical protein
MSESIHWILSFCGGYRRAFKLLPYICYSFSSTKHVNLTNSLKRSVPTKTPPPPSSRSPAVKLATHQCTGKSSSSMNPMGTVEFGRSAMRDTPASICTEGSPTQTSLASQVISCDFFGWQYVLVWHYPWTLLLHSAHTGFPRALPAASYSGGITNGCSIIFLSCIF